MNLIQKNNLGFLVYCLFTLILSSIDSDILSQTKVSTTNWPDPVFEHITIKDGLPENSVLSLLQDRFGYMWLGTQNGLVRYDGYSMKVYSRDPDDPLSISASVISVIYEDKEGTLWVGTKTGGLNRFNRKTETFTRYIHNPDDSASIFKNKVLSINEDKNENILIGTGEGLVLFKKSENTFKRIKKIADNGTTIKLNYPVEAIILDSLTKNIFVSCESEILVYNSENELLRRHRISELEDKLGVIHSFYQAKDGTIWIGHDKGLARFNSLKNTIKFFQPDPSGSGNYANIIHQIIEDDNGYIWCGNLSKMWVGGKSGLRCFNPLEGNFKSYKYDSQNEWSISNNNICSIFRNRSGIIWVGTQGGGLNKWDIRKQKFKRYWYDSETPKGRSLIGVNSFAEDPEKTIWLGGNRLYNFNPLSKKFNNYWRNSDYVHCIYVDDTEAIWIGTSERGLGKINTATGSLYFYSNNPQDSTTISNNFVMTTT